jgi:hypothetical protein
MESVIGLLAEDLVAHAIDVGGGDVVPRPLVAEQFNQQTPKCPHIDLRLSWLSPSQTAQLVVPIHVVV